MIEVSAGVIYNMEGRILICRRGTGRHHAHLWEFPGGKRESGETAADCLARELLEELSLPVRDIRKMDEHACEGIRFTFLTARTDGQPIRTEHEDVRFVTPSELLRFDFCPADGPIARKLALQSIRHVFWDFDGTLMDSYPAMVRAFTAAAAEYGVSVAPERTLDLMKDCLTHCCEVVGAENNIPAAALYHAFRRHEEDELLRGLPPMPGIPETLRAMRQAGVKHYVATHRDLVCRELLDSAGLLTCFSGFVTREDGLPRKPAPEMLLHLMDRHGLNPAECMMAGDRPLDTESGRNAGILSVLIDPEDRFPDAVCDLHIRNPLTELSPVMGQTARDVPPEAGNT